MLVEDCMRELFRLVHRDPRGFFQLARYGIVGVMSNVVFFLVSNLVYAVTSQAMVSSAVGGILSIFISLFGHGHFTYRSRYDAGVIIRFFVLVAWNMSLIQLITYFGEIHLMVSYTVTTLSIVVIVPLFSFS